MPSSQTLPYYLGCPAWSCADWISTVFRADLDKRELLREYAKTFNTVEGNTVFYALPPLATVERWMAESSHGFRFALKFPKAISHERRLHGAEEETRAFLKILETLQHGERLGPAYLQLPPSFNANSFDILESYLKSLPKDFAYALEPRHVSFFDQHDNEKRLDDTLSFLGIDKVIFDARPLFSQKPQDTHEEAAQARKPQTPHRKTVTGPHPFLRFIGRNDLNQNDKFIKEWAPIINKWILEGKKPYLFTHAPNEANAPYLARALHDQLRKLNPLISPLPAFLSDHPQRPTPHQEQLDLF